MVPILTQVLIGNFLLLPLYLGYITKQRSMHVVISFICWFRVIRVLFCVFWSLHSWRRWSRKWGSGDIAMVDIQTFQRAIFECIPVSLLTLFSGKEHNSQSWDYSPQALDYRNFRIIGHQITRILPYIKKLRGLSPQANYTDRAAAAGRRS